MSHLAIVQDGICCAWPTDREERIREQTGRNGFPAGRIWAGRTVLDPSFTPA
jgi:hypothetical protein